MGSADGTAAIGEGKGGRAMSCDAMNFLSGGLRIVLAAFCSLGIERR
jgi:hypothetical protein